MYITVCVHILHACIQHCINALIHTYMHLFLHTCALTYIRYPPQDPTLQVPRLDTLKISGIKDSQICRIYFRMQNCRMAGSQNRRFPQAMIWEGVQAMGSEDLQFGNSAHLSILSGSHCQDRNTIVPFCLLPLSLCPWMPGTLFCTKTAQNVGR